MTVQVQSTMDKEQIYELINVDPLCSAVFLPQGRRTMAGLALAQWFSECYQGKKTQPPLRQERPNLNTFFAWLKSGRTA